MGSVHTLKQIQAHGRLLLHQRVKKAWIYKTKKKKKKIGEVRILQVLYIKPHWRSVI